MGFSFNPTLWFVCRLCRRSFVDTETLKEHMLACHLGECMGIKCIVFEERLLNEEWMPEHDFSENPYTIPNETAKESSKTESSFKNPTVLLTRLTGLEINSSLNGNSSSHECQGMPTSSSENGIPFDEEVQLKIEFPSYDESTHANSVGNEEDYADTNLDDVKDLEFIVASVSSNSDGIPQVEFASTLIPASSNEYQLYQQQQQFQTTFEDDSNPLMAFADSESQHHEKISNIGTNEFNSNLTTVEVQSQKNTLPLPLQVQITEHQVKELLQQQGSTALVNFQSKSGAGESAKKPFMCEICCASFRRRDKLTIHMLCHSSIRPFKCSKCPSAFKRKDHLTRHQLVHGVESNFKCRFCSRFIRHKWNLVQHERHHAKYQLNQRPYPTSSNSSADFKTTVNIAELEHQEMISNNEVNDLNSNSTNEKIKIKADITDLSPAVPENDLLHQLIDTRIREEDPQTHKPIQPAILTSQIQEPKEQVGYSRKHQSSNLLLNYQSRPSKCSKCPLKFKFKGHLDRHQVVHGKESKFKCRFCNKYFGQNCHLEDHERIHTGDKPFKCSVAHCIFAASNKGGLTAHTRARHGSELGLQQHICPTCGKTYGLKKSLHAHILIRHS